MSAEGDDGSPPPPAGEVADRGGRFAVRVRIDGRELPLKVFLHDMLGGAVTGLVQGLRDVGTPERVEIVVRRI